MHDRMGPLRRLPLGSAVPFIGNVNSMPGLTERELPPARDLQWLDHDS